MKTYILLFSFISMFLIFFYEKMPQKVNFVYDPPPRVMIDCYIIDGKCEHEEFYLEIIQGNFSALENTRINFISKSELVANESLLITSDDGLIGTIEAKEITPNVYEFLIPFCSNEEMNILIFFKNSKYSVKII